MKMSWKYRMYQILSLLRRMRRPYCLLTKHLWVEDDDCSIHCDRCDLPLDVEVDSSEVRWL